MAHTAKDSLHSNYFQIFLGVVGTLLLLWTLSYTRRAANIAERALTELERPFLLPSLQPTTFEARRDQRHRTFLRYEFCNYGRTPAFITHRRVGCIIVNPTLDIPEINESDKISEFTMAQGEKHQWEHINFPKINFRDLPLPTTNGDIILQQPQFSGGNTMYFFVFIRYRDFSMKSHDTLRCWKYETLGFRLLESDKYNRTT